MQKVNCDKILCPGILVIQAKYNERGRERERGRETKREIRKKRERERERDRGREIGIEGRRETVCVRVEEKDRLGNKD